MEYGRVGRQQLATIGGCAKVYVRLAVHEISSGSQLTMKHLVVSRY